MVKVKPRGSTAIVTSAKSPPANPQTIALLTKARSFQFAVRTPRLEEAISLVAMARNALPARYFSALSTNRMTIKATTHTR